jgi:uncharacterized membrane protein YfcA
MTFPLTLPESLVACAAVAVGATLQGAAGFGVALIAVPVLLLIDTALIPGPLIAAGVLLALLIALRDRRSIHTAGLTLALVGRVAGTVPAALAVVALHEKGFAITCGALVLAAVVLSLLGPKLRPTSLNVFLAGILSGFMGTVSSIGGPPMALVYQRSSGPRLRGTLSAFLAIGGAMSLIALAAAGRFGRAELALAAVLFPGALLGFAASSWATPIVDRGAIRPLVLLLSSATAAAVLVRAFL